MRVGIVKIVITLSELNKEEHEDDIKMPVKNLPSLKVTRQHNFEHQKAVKEQRPRRQLLPYIIQEDITAIQRVVFGAILAGQISLPADENHPRQLKVLLQASQVGTVDIFQVQEADSPLKSVRLKVPGHPLSHRGQHCRREETVSR